MEQPRKRGLLSMLTSLSPLRVLDGGHVVTHRTYASARSLALGLRLGYFEQGLGWTAAPSTWKVRVSPLDTMQLSSRYQKSEERAAPAPCAPLPRRSTPQTLHAKVCTGLPHVI